MDYFDRVKLKFQDIIQQVKDARAQDIVKDHVNKQVNNRVKPKYYSLKNHLQKNWKIYLIVALVLAFMMIMSVTYFSEKK